MADRKPAGMSFQSFIEQRIQAAMRRGDFDDLPGAGKPIPDLDQPYDESWWLKGLMKREQLELTPAAWELRREVERFFETLGRHVHERSVERALDRLNDRILDVNRTLTSGPPSDLMPLPHADVLRRWRVERTRYLAR